MSEPIVVLAAETNRRLRIAPHEAQVLADVLRRVIPRSDEERVVLPELVQRLERMR
jgi:hypothetical protein